jgi:hypothetical protein
MPNRIFEDWEDYDNRKIRDGRDRSKFSCDEEWEVGYLIRKIRMDYPSRSEEDIRTAIRACCREVGAPRPRKEFVKCVLERLGLA